MPLVKIEAKINQTPTQSISYAPNSVSHIKQRHWYNANSGPNTSHFHRSMTIKKLNALATKTIANGSTSYSKNGNKNKVHDYTFRKPIGTTSNGKNAKTLRVVTNPKGKIVTAFPKK